MSSLTMTLLNGNCFFVTVGQRVKDGFSSSRKCSITWPANVEIAEFKDSGDCWGIMFPSDFFLGEQNCHKMDKSKFTS